MQGYHPETYGERIAEFYDEMYGETYPGPAVAFLSAGARGGRVLELAIGTGRNALPTRRGSRSPAHVAWITSHRIDGLVKSAV